MAELQPALAQLWKAALLDGLLDESEARQHKALLRGLPRPRGMNCDAFQLFRLDDAGLTVEFDAADEGLSEPFIDELQADDGQRSWGTAGSARWRSLARTGLIALNSR